MYHPSLEYFCAIVEQGKITAAADYLHITQQALSGYLKRLEDHYGIALFNRTPFLELTPFGVDLYKSCVQIRDIQNQIEEALSRHNNELTIRLACPPSLSGNLYHILPLRKYRKLYPNVRLELKTTLPDKQLQNIEKGISDFLIVNHDKFNQGRYLKLDEKPHYIICHQTLLAKCHDDKYQDLIKKQDAEVSLKDFAQFPYLSIAIYGQFQKQLDEWAKNKDIKLKKTSESVEKMITIEMCNMGLGFLIGSWYDTLLFEKNPEILCFPMVEPDIKKVIGLFAKTETLNIPHMKDFWNLCSRETN